MRVKIRHLVKQKSGYYYQATPKMKAAGIFSEPLGRNRAKAVARAEYLNAEWDKIRAGAEAPRHQPRTIAWLCDQYTASSWYRRLAPATQSNVDHALGIVKKALGEHDIATIKRGHVRALHEIEVERVSEGRANDTVKWLRRALSYAVERGWRTDNPAHAMGLQSPRARRHKWTIEEIQRVKDTAIAEGRFSIALTVQLAYDTSQRLSDVLGLRWQDFDGEGLTFDQEKTGQEVWVPLSPESLRMLAEVKGRIGHIIVGDVAGKPMGRHYFQRLYSVIKAKAGIREELQFRDLRRTAISEVMSGGGRSEPISGHRPGSPVLRVYEVPDKEAARLSQQARPGNKSLKASE